MREQFVNRFIARMDGIISDDELQIIQQQLSIFVSDYDISIRETSLAPYQGYLPECYKVYLVTKKIEGLSQKTLELYKMYLDDFFFEMNKDIKEITTNDIRVYLYRIQEQRHISNRTLDSRRAAIHAFFEWATDEDYVNKNPCRAIKPIKYERKDREPLTAIELEMVRKACNTKREKAMIEFFYSTGCRVTEMENMNISDVDFEKKEVVLFGKGNKHRKSYLNAKAELALKDYLQERDDDNEALFVKDRKPHTRFMKAGIEKNIREIGKRSGIERPLFPHLIRHTTATDGLAHGMNVTEVQKLLGHANIATTMIYAKVSEEDTKNNHRKCIV